MRTVSYSLPYFVSNYNDRDKITLPFYFFTLVLAENGSETSSFATFLILKKKKINQDPPALSILLVRSPCLSQTVNWALRSLVLKSKSLWAPFRGTTHAHSLCVATATRRLRSIPQKVAHAWTNGFVYILISSVLWAQGPLGRAEITCSQCFVI